MSDDITRVREICAALGVGGVWHEVAPLSFTSDEQRAAISLRNGHGFVFVFENGLWHISGEARAKVIELRDTIYLQARKILDEQHAQAQREYAEEVERNNAFVMTQFNVG